MVFAWFSVKKFTMYVYTEICGYSHDFCEKVDHAFYRNSINKITYQFSTNHQISFIQMLRYDAILPHVLNSVWGSLQVHKVMWILKSLQDCKTMFENYKVMLPQISLQDCKTMSIYMLNKIYPVLQFDCLNRMSTGWIMKWFLACINISVFSPTYHCTILYFLIKLVP